MQRAIVVALLCVAPLSAAGCPNDCSLNGECQNSGCKCDAAWEGDDCSRLALLPSPAEPAYGGTSTDFASWGGGVLHADGEYHMFVAEFANHCGLQSWQKNSFIRHAVSKSPTGPFVAKEIVKSHESHGPTPVYDSHTGTFLIYHDFDGSGSELCTGCKNGLTNNDNPCGAGARGDARNMTLGWPRVAGSSRIMHSRNVSGPWSDIDSDGWWNPAPFVNPDGSVVMVAQTDLFSIVTAPKWQGPYTQDKQPVLPAHQEDPFLWRDSRGSYHMLMHGMKPYAQEQWAGRHAYSRSGAAGTWTLSPTAAYTSIINYEDGSTKHHARRERPHVLLDASGSPTHLYTSVQEQWGTSTSRNDKTYTHVQKIRTGSPSPPSPGPPPSPGDWIIEDGVNYFNDCSTSLNNWVDLGHLGSKTACQEACGAHPGCQSWTWRAYGGSDDSCVGRTDGYYHHVQEGGHYSGRMNMTSATSSCSSPAPSPGHWIIEDDVNYFSCCSTSLNNWVDLGHQGNKTACQAACGAHPGCQSWTWPAYGSSDDLCVGRTDGYYHHVQEGGHHSGRLDTTSLSSSCNSGFGDGARNPKQVIV